MNNRTWWAVFKARKQGRATSPALNVAGESSAHGEVPLKNLPARLADCVAATDGPADPGERERWLQEHARGR